MRVKMTRCVYCTCFMECGVLSRRAKILFRWCSHENHLVRECTTAFVIVEDHSVPQAHSHYEEEEEENYIVSKCEVTGHRDGMWVMRALHTSHDFNQARFRWLFMTLMFPFTKVFAIQPSETGNKTITFRPNQSENGEKSANFWIILFHLVHAHRFMPIHPVN